MKGNPDFLIDRGSKHEEIFFFHSDDFFFLWIESRRDGGKEFIARVSNHLIDPSAFIRTH
jgi:hypothetical protein